MSVLLASLMALAHASPTDINPYTRTSTPGPQTQRATADAGSGSVSTSRRAAQSARTVSITLSPDRALTSLADLQLSYRLFDQVGLVVAGTAGRSSTSFTLGDPAKEAGFRVDVETTRLGGGIGAHYFFKDFEEGLFVGVDVAGYRDGYAAGVATTVLQATPRLGWKVIGKHGLTFSADIGLGHRQVLSAVPEPMPQSTGALSGRTHLGWSF